MLTAVWSMKGGVGVSTVAAMLAIAQSERAEKCLLVDLCGDQPALLGVDRGDGLGIADWCATPERAPDALGRIELEVRVDLKLLPSGVGTVADCAGDLVEALTRSPRQVVVDCGVLRDNPSATRVAGDATVSLIVVRACYLALHASRATPVSPTGVVFVRERGRALGLADVESIFDAPVVADIALDGAIARSIDAGLTTSRLPRSLVRALAGVINDAA